MEKGITEGKSGSVRYWRGILLQENGTDETEVTDSPESVTHEEDAKKVSSNPVRAVPSVPSTSKEKILGMPVFDVISIWNKAGKPIIHLCRKNCFDLEKLLNSPDTSDEDLRRVREWLDNQSGV